jgi:hypothetical protein
VRRRNRERRAGRQQRHPRPRSLETHPAWAADGRPTYHQHAEGPVHVRVDTLGEGRGPLLPIDGSFVFDWTP